MFFTLMLSAVLQLKVVTNVIVKVLQLITLDVFIGSMDRGFGFGVLCAPARYAAARFFVCTVCAV